MAPKARTGKTADAKAPTPAAGDKVPDFKLATDAGTEISRASLKGKPYVLYFYPKDDTSGCTREAVDFSAAAAKFARAGDEIIGVSKDSLASHEKFRAKHKKKNKQTTEPENEAAQTNDDKGEKSLYGRKYMGVERATFLVDAT